MKVLVTGAAGFIGHHLSKLLVKNGMTVVGLDSINDYYDQRLKYARLEDMGIETSNIPYNELVKGDIDFFKIELEDLENVKKLIYTEVLSVIFNLKKKKFGIVFPLLEHSVTE